MVSSLKSRFAKHEGDLLVGVLTPSDSPLLDKLPDTPGISWHRYALGPLSQPSITAQRLFDGLLSLEADGADIILIEAVAEENEGLAVMNRVKKAAGETMWLEA